MNDDPGGMAGDRDSRVSVDPDYSDVLVGKESIRGSEFLEPGDPLTAGARCEWVRVDGEGEITERVVGVLVRWDEDGRAVVRPVWQKSPPCEGEPTLLV